MRKELTFKEALRAAKGMGENTIIVDLLLENYQEAEETICRWLDDHPLKTRKSDLLEKYPDAPISPLVFPLALGRRNFHSERRYHDRNQSAGIKTGGSLCPVAPCAHAYAHFL